MPRQLAYSDLDFKAADRDGWEIPWPISYKDVAPYSTASTS